MSLSEFQVIERYFARGSVTREDVVLGVGDDAALLQVPLGHQLFTAIATLTEGTHFLPDADPGSLGHRALAVPLSRLAGAGAAPAWATLALTVPSSEEPWLERFSEGFQRLAHRFDVQLVGGDTTQGPRSTTVVASGLVPDGPGNLRGQARDGDLIYVTGTLGEAGLAILAQQRMLRLPVADRRLALQRLEWPEPRIRCGLALHGLASAVTDLPEGLAMGLDEILKASEVGASIYAERLPVSARVRARLHDARDWDLLLTSGGDHELCFTVAPGKQRQLEARFSRLGESCTWIGIVERTPGLRCVAGDGSTV